MIFLNPEKYRTVGEWRKDMQTQGYSVPLPMCFGLSKIMKKYNITFDEAFNFFAKHQKIMLVGHTFIYDLTADKL